MTKRMLVDATHPEETRVSIVDGNWLSDFDFERASKMQLKGNIYLAKVIRVEPSLQAAFVEYGGNRHGFLPFSEIHPDYFRIPVADRPHDAPEIDDEEEDDAAVAAADLEAHAQDIDHLHDHEHDEPEDHDFHHPIIENGSEEVLSPVAIQAQPVDGAATPLVENIPALHEFAHAPENDLGLITDFGLAATPDGIAPVEVIGGEVAEEEQRFRRVRKPNYKIQEVVKRRQVMLIQVVKEERGNKGAALTTFLSLAGRYCVLMPNTDSGGGVSRKITSHQDRRRMKEMLDQLEIPEGMAVILRTAGMEQEPAEIQRDLEYLLRLWNNIREQTLQSTAPSLIYEEANLIKRTLRDMYSRDLDEILVSGQKGYQLAVDFMRTIMPDQLDKIKPYEDPVPLFFRYNVEKQIDQLYNTTVQLRSGGYIVINPTEALVSIDVNSGRATRERHIESTALKTNLEAAEEIGRQLRLRDLAGLVVIDFIDMEDNRNNAAVERRIKEAMRADRARLQIGRISPFGLLELSRQRLHPSLMEINFEKCPHCAGVGLVRSVDSAAISILHVIEEEGLRNGGGEMVLHVPPKVALYILNQKRSSLSEIEKRYGLQVLMHSDEALVPPDYKLERSSGVGESRSRAPVNIEQAFTERAYVPEEPRAPALAPLPMDERIERPRAERGERPDRGGEGGGRRRGRYGTGGGGGGRNGRRDNGNQTQSAGGYGFQVPAQPYQAPSVPVPEAPENDMAHGDAVGNNVEAVPHDPNNPDQQRRGRRRGRRGGRGRRPNVEGGLPNAAAPQGEPGTESQPPQDFSGERPGRQRPPRGDRYGHQGNPNSGERQNRQPRPNQQGGNWNNRGPADGNRAAPVNPLPQAGIPASIHDIDTTPRPSYTPRPSNTPNTSQPATAPGHVPYQVVSESSDDKPKGGWWRRLTGQ